MCILRVRMAESSCRELSLVERKKKRLVKTSIEHLPRAGERRLSAAAYVSDRTGRGEKISARETGGVGGSKSVAEEDDDDEVNFYLNIGNIRRWVGPLV